MLKAFSGPNIAHFFPYSLEHDETFGLSLVSFRLSAPPNDFCHTKFMPYCTTTDLYS